ncbi:hypothetical protein FSP39_012098 [Pinctada imbricata]|uniref:Uncharacterized protein n=1 Tax=Pinctada imbricata TaxID=66713 RepID=A0AA89C3L9_PINIB|nr:hypothetical protein FSP39_012098 [Pinctada imbricata]
MITEHNTRYPYIAWDGLKDNQLSLALEPEAASLYCRRVPVQIVTLSDGAKQIASLPEGSKYLVLDLGGGTIDITAHEVAKDGGLRELHQAFGGTGEGVNEGFTKFLTRLVGGDVIHKMKDESPGEWLDLLNEFEMKKCNFVSGDRDKVTIRVTGLAGQAKSERGGVYACCRGYSESPLMINALKKKFPNVRVVVPATPGLAVLTGAVIYGYEPDIIASRVASYTYGIAKQRIWKEGDPERKKSHMTTRKGLHWCDDVFDKHVEIGRVVKIGEFQEAKDYYPIQGDQKYAILEFYASTEKDPKFIDDPNMELVGLFVFELSERKEGDDGKVLVRIGVGGTELEVEVKEASTGRIFKTYCNFLP